MQKFGSGQPCIYDKGRIREVHLIPGQYLNLFPWFLSIFTILNLENSILRVSTRDFHQKCFGKLLNIFWIIIVLSLSQKQLLNSYFKLGILGFYLIKWENGSISTYFFGFSYLDSLKYEKFDYLTKNLVLPFSFEVDISNIFFGFGRKVVNMDIIGLVWRIDCVFEILGLFWDYTKGKRS